jgi:hypothetical protein
MKNDFSASYRTLKAVFMSEALPTSLVICNNIVDDRADVKPQVGVLSRIRYA